MRKQTRWLIGAMLSIVAAYLVLGSLVVDPVKPVYAQAVCGSPSASISITDITPNTLYNTADTPITITGAGFGTPPPNGTVVLAGYGPLTIVDWADGVIHATVPAGLPGTPSGRAYNVIVFQSDPDICSSLANGLRIYSPAPTTVARTSTPVPTTFARPLVTVLSYGASSKVLYPGQNIDFEITLQNTGSTTAKNVIIEFSGNDLLPRETGGLRAAGDIGSGGSVRLFQPLRVDSGLSGYEAVIDVKISYTDEYGKTYSDAATLSFAAGQYAEATATLSLSPQLVLSAYQTNPAVLSPGATFKLDLSLANVSDKIAHQVLVDLQTTSASGSAPATTLNSSNLRYVDAMQPGQQVPLSFDMAVNGDATSALSSLNLAISYVDDSNQQHSQTETISLRIETKALLLIHFYNEMPDLLTVGDIIDLPVEVINIGENDLNVSMVEVTSDQMSITGGSIYFGPLSGGTSGTLLAQAQLTRAGTATVTVTVHYLDDFQQQQVATQDLILEVEAVEVTPVGSTGPDGSGNTGTGAPGGNFGDLTIGQRILRMILGFFGIATQSFGGSGVGMPQQPTGSFGENGMTPQPAGGNLP